MSFRYTRLAFFEMEWDVFELKSHFYSWQPQFVGNVLLGWKVNVYSFSTCKCEVLVKKMVQAAHHGAAGGRVKVFLYEVLVVLFKALVLIETVWIIMLVCRESGPTFTGLYIKNPKCFL